MAKHNQRAEDKQDQKRQRRAKPVATELANDQASLTDLPGGPIAAAGDGTIQAQAGRLGDTRLQTAQRQALAAQIGRVQGNCHLQRVVAALQPDEQEETQPLSGTLEPIEGDPLIRGEQFPGRADTAANQTALAKVQGVPPASEPLKVNAHLMFASETEDGWDGGRNTRADAVKGTLSYGSRVGGGHSPPAGKFGEEMATVRVDKVSWKRGDHTINVGARVFLDCKWGVQSLGNTNVASGSDPAVTPNTWKKIVKDLTPDARGEPTRKHYWARDITIRHERFHASDDTRRAQRYLPTAQNWLNIQFIRLPTPGWGEWLHEAVSSEAVQAREASETRRIETGVRAHLDTVRDNVEADINAYYLNGGEDRAYADGKWPYNQRVAEVRERATKEGWK